MNDLISICVTTRHRPDLLRQSLESLIRQQYRPLEIIVGDNSDDDESTRVVDELILPEGVALIYQRHQPSGDLWTNTDWVFTQARGGRMVLMHDDDMLCDGGLDILVEAWDAHPGVAVVYGKSYQITHAGAHDLPETDRVNAVQERTPDRAGPQRSSLRAALTQQFPRNGYLADAALLKQVGWRPYRFAGVWTDVDCGIRLATASAPRPFVYVDKFVSKIRLTETRVSNTRTFDTGALQFLDQVRLLDVPSESRSAWERLVRTLTEMAVVEAARAGQRSRALRLLRSEYYQRAWLHPATLYRLLCVLSPAMARTCNRVFRGLAE
jgi:glycosyltransferase involved in cell wall biosynthesis